MNRIQNIQSDQSDVAIRPQTVNNSNNSNNSNNPIRPDYYSSREECKKNLYSKFQTNPRYKFFNQTHFTAGDEEQFQNSRDRSRAQQNKEKFESFPKSNLVEFIKIPTKYQNLNASVVDDTFRYLFYKFKKGIFVQIENNEIKTFLPFSNKNFVNEWSERIQIDPKYKSPNDFFEQIQLLQNRKFFPKSINKFANSWYANNCLVRYEFPINEGDTNVPVISDMLKTLCKERKLPSIEFFINKRDFPLLKLNNTEPYEHIFDDDNFPLLSHNYKKYLPILSMTSEDQFADLAIPTVDDWARIGREEGKYFPHSEDREFEIKEIDWQNKKPIAVFRGASTGAGVTIETNPRLKIAYLSKLESDRRRKSNKPVILDAGITEWNLRPRKLKEERYLKTIDISSLPFSLVNPLTPQEQSEYKYIVNIDGHVSAYRLSLELHFGSCILLVDSKYKLWFSPLLKPMKHFVPVKRDLSDLFEKIEWCIQHDDECRKIAKNGRKFAKKYLSREGVLDYLQQLFWKLKEEIGHYTYNSISLDVIRDRLELQVLDKRSDKISQKSLTPIQNRKNFVFNVRNFVPDPSPIFQNNNSTITVLNSIETKIIEKKRNTPYIHEIFVNMKCINPLSKLIPNFIYTFGYSSDYTSLYLEKLDGQTLNEYIKSPNFSFSTFLFIFLQISLALSIAQEEYGFVHFDLTPWNIILVKKERRKIEYITSKGIYTLETDLIPVIIDMERSHFVLNNVHYGRLNTFRVNTIQDIFSLLITSLGDIILFPLDSRIVKSIIYLCNFLTGTKYKKEKFVKFGEVRQFLTKARKYNELIHVDKKDLNNKNPLDFVKYILKTEKFPIFFTQISGSEEAHADSKSNLPPLPREVLQQLPETGNRFIFEQIKRQVTRKYSITTEFLEKYEDVKNESFKVSYLSELKLITPISFDDRIFCDMKKIYKLFETVGIDNFSVLENKFNLLTKSRKIIRETLFSSDDSKFVDYYFEQLKPILNVNISTLFSFANLKTLLIYTNHIQEANKLFDKSTNQSELFPFSDLASEMLASEEIEYLRELRKLNASCFATERFIPLS